MKDPFDSINVKESYYKDSNSPFIECGEHHNSNNKIY